MSGSDPPPDNSYQVEMLRQNSAKEAQAAEDAKAAARKAELAGLRTSSRGTAGTDVRNYFSQHGVDPSRYGGDIDSQLNAILGGISPSDENPGSAFSGAGQSIWDTLQGGERTKANASLDKYFQPNYATTRAPMTLDDSYWQGYEGEQYASANDIIQNMLDRGVLTSTGYSSAKTSLDNQRAGVKSNLNTIGNNLVSGEQSALNDIVGRGRTAANTLNLGQTFDPTTFSGEADQSFNTFLSGLGDQIRAAAPGTLFKTAGLAAVGGAGQGAGNTAFNPDAVAGIADDPESADDTAANSNSIF